jgi:hypothetical protein
MMRTGACWKENAVTGQSRPESRVPCSSPTTNDIFRSCMVLCTNSWDECAGHACFRSDVSRHCKCMEESKPVSDMVTVGSENHQIDIGGDDSAVIRRLMPFDVMSRPSDAGSIHPMGMD